MSINVISLESLASELNKKKDEQRMTRAFKMDFSYVPKKEKGLVKLGDSTICSVGNVWMIIAPPGTGKSNVCEAVASGVVNPECDCLGFSIECEKGLFIDTERVHNDFYRGLLRIKKRCGKPEDEILSKLDAYSFIDIDNVEECWNEFEHIVSVGEYELVILDGSADFVKSVNDEEESKSFWRKLIALANKKGFGVLITIHPNPGDAEGKATGHLGSQGMKKAESVFNVLKSPDDKDVRIITTESNHGKVRNAADKVTTSFRWDKEKAMFVACDTPQKKKKKSDVADLFDTKDSYTYNELCRSVMDSFGVSLSTARRKIKDAEDIGDIFKNSGLYWRENGIERENDGLKSSDPFDDSFDQDDDIPF